MKILLAIIKGKTPLDSVRKSSGPEVFGIYYKIINTQYTLLPCSTPYPYLLWAVGVKILFQNSSR